MDDFGISLTEENLLFSLYSIPNMVLPLFGGVFADRIGIRLCLILFISIITFGQVIIVIGAYKTNFAVLLIGRIVFGLGSEISAVA